MRPASTRPWPQWLADQTGFATEADGDGPGEGQDGAPRGGAAAHEDEEDDEHERGELHSGRDPEQHSGPAVRRPEQVDQDRQHDQDVDLAEREVLQIGSRATAPSARSATSQPGAGRSRTRRARAATAASAATDAAVQRPAVSQAGSRASGDMHHRREGWVGESQPGHRVARVRSQPVQHDPSPVLVDEQVGEAAVERTGDGRDADQGDDRSGPSEHAGPHSRIVGTIGHAGGTTHAYAAEPAPGASAQSAAGRVDDHEADLAGLDDDSVLVRQGESPGQDAGVTSAGPPRPGDLDGDAHGVADEDRRVEPPPVDAEQRDRAVLEDAQP